MKWTIPERIIQQGRKYADEGRVTGVTQDLNQEVWHAEVIGSTIYQVELDGGPREEDVCTCTYWQDKGFCKHTVAVELALRDKGLNRILKQNKHLQSTYQAPSMATVFTESFTKLQDELTSLALQAPQKLQVEFLISSVPISAYHLEKSIFGLSFKLGFEGGRTYVVKNAHEFLKRLAAGGVYQLGEDLELVLTEGNFSTVDWELLQQALRIHLSTQLVAGSGLQLKGSMKYRYVLLPPRETQFFLKKLNKLDKLHLVVGEQTLRKVFFAEGLLPIEVEVIPVEQGFSLLINHQVSMYWENYRWVKHGATIYQLTAEQLTVYQTLIQLLKRVDEPVIFYPEESVADLFAYVLPSLSVIAEVYVAESVQTEMIRLPLKTTIVLSATAQSLNARVDFHYGDEVFSSDDAYTTATEKTPLVIRNQVQEHRIKQFLTFYDFTLRAVGYTKVLPVKEELYHLFASELPEMRKFATVEVDESLSRLYLAAASYQPEIEIVEDGSWLDIRFDISNIAPTDVDQVMLSLVNQESFYQLPSGEILALDSEIFQQTSHALSQLRDQLKYEDGKFLIPKFRGLQLEEALRETATPTSFSADFQQLVADLTQPEALTTALPAGLEADLRQYQVAGYRWLKMLSQYRFGGILADEMGLGKTLQGIAYLLSEKADGVTDPSIVVAPASLIYNWQMECEKFAPSLKTLVVSGNKEERERMIATQGADVDLLITSYATLRQDVALYQDLAINCLILDEAQMVKNSATKTFQAIKELPTQQRFAFSGTPIENNIEELWSLFYMLMPGFFPSKAKFKQLTTEEIAKMIQPFVLRREKKDVLKDLPDKIESNLYSSLTEEQKTVYLAHLRQMQETVSGMSHESFKQNRLSVLAGLTRLRQICCDPRLFIDDYQGASGKLEQVKELVLAAKASGRRILLFSQFTSMLSLIEKEFADLGLDTFYLRGSTPPKTRLEMVEAFNSGEKDVFLISLKAGGTGLNLTGADTVILYDLWWNPAVEEQAAGRAHRMGQKKVVEVWRLIAEGTIEEKMNQLQNDKRELFNQVMNAEEEQQLAKLTEADIREILNVGLG